jgi:lipoprotein-releasing system ATP-binding protein
MILKLEQLCRYYQDGDRVIEVINNVNFTFPEQGMVAISGESGVGKSTLLQLLGGLDRPTKGHIWFNGTDLGALRGDDLSNLRGSQIGFVFQFHHLLPEFSAEENVAMPLIISGLSNDDAIKRAQELLYRVGLSTRLSHRPSALSGGEQQRVAIARALVTNPSLVLLDEPTGNLDHGNAETVKSLLSELNQEQKNLMVVVTHSAELASSLDFHFKMQPGGGFLEA